MADAAPVVHIGENSPEQVAYNLMIMIANQEEKKLRDQREGAGREWTLNTYAECLMTVQDPDGRLRGNHITHEDALKQLK